MTDTWENHRPLDSEVESAIAALRLHADQLELSQAARKVQASDRKAALVADARDAIEKSKANGHRWQLWESIVNEWVAGSEDERGTSNDRIRKMASALDTIGPLDAETKFNFTISYHTRSIDEAVEVALALEGARWQTQTGSSMVWLKADWNDMPVTLFLPHNEKPNDVLLAIKEALTARAEQELANARQGDSDASAL